MNQADKQIILGALDSLGCALADHDHQWSIGELEIYEQAIQLLGVRVESEPKWPEEGEGEWKL